MRRNDDDEVPFWMDDAGGRGNALGSNEAGAVLHRRHQHTLHVRWPRRHRVSAQLALRRFRSLHLDRSKRTALLSVVFLVQGDHACHVEAAEVQVHLPAGYGVRVHADAA
ncbi:hypothetical protein BHE74_00052203, partial [Ensete ventricosum]